ncbi:MAG: phosphodiester glycosidase family protein, partial [Pseudomonadota bacterium]
MREPTSTKLRFDDSEGRYTLMRMRVFVLSALSIILLTAGGAPQTSGAEVNDGASGDGTRHCAVQTFRNADYVVCRFDPAQQDIRLFLNNQDGKPFGHFNWVKESLASKGEDLLFAMNAGMYHEDRMPVGLYIEGGETLAPLNNNDGPGNFHLKPNGIFYVAPDGRAYIEETETFLRIKQPPPRYATQSGPMLLIG